MMTAGARVLVLGYQSAVVLAVGCRCYDSETGGGRAELFLPLLQAQSPVHRTMLMSRNLVGTIVRLYTTLLFLAKCITHPC